MSTSTITINPVTRIEGHAKITIQVDGKGIVQDARFHVNEFRGFEKFCEGRLMWEMGGITSTHLRHLPDKPSHHLGKSGRCHPLGGHSRDRTEAAPLITLAQWLQSHALSFFHLSSPDFLLGFDSDPANRNIFGLIAHDKEFARTRNPPAEIRPGNH